MFRARDLKAGDEVCVETYYGGKKFTKVKRVTPSGIVVLENDTRFNTDGLELGTSAEKYRRDHLASASAPSAGHRRHDPEDIARMERIKTVDVQVKAMKEALDNLHSSGNDHYWVSAESLGLINQLTESLKKPFNGYASDLPGEPTAADAA